MKKKIMSVVFLAIATMSLASCGKKVEVDNDAQTVKIDEYVNSDAFISVSELNEKLNGDNAPIVIGTIDKSKALPGTVAANKIDGAYLVWRPNYSGNGSAESITDEINGFRTSQENMETLMSKIGAEADSEIVVYSANSHHDSTRLYWQIKLLGHENVKVLDGGINAWVGSGMETGKGTRIEDVEMQTSYKAKDYDPEKYSASTEMVVEALENPDEWVVIDTRGLGEFEGKDLLGGASGKGGLLGAVHIGWTDALTEDGLLKTKSELEEVYGDLKDKKVIAFCQSGVRSAHTYTVLKEALGLDEVYNYDGSWIEWSYIASTVSDGKVDENLKESVLGLTTNWTDNGKIK